MMKHCARGLMSAALALGVWLPGSAQTYTCLPDTTHALYYFVARLATATDSATVATRNALQLPAVARSKVTVVTTASVCKQAGDAYHAAVTPPGTPPVSRTLVVIKVGMTRYVVLDPNERTGEFRNNIVLDSKWKFLIGFTE